MKYKYIGKTGLKVSAIGLGTMVFGTDECDENSAIKVIDAALDAGINLLDTADMYLGGSGASEKIIGKAITKKRDSVVLATKVGFKMGPGPNDIGLSRSHIFKAVEDSLRRLKTDYIDLYYVHAIDETTSFEETLSALDDLVHQGKVRYIGCSNFRAWQLCKARSISERYNLSRFEVIQSPYNLVVRDIETELLHYCAAEDIGVTTYNPLASGLLTGQFERGKAPEKGTRFASAIPGTTKAVGQIYIERYLTDINFEAMSRLKQVAEDHGRNLIQFALAWILNNETITSVLCGISSQEQLNVDLTALDVKLSEEELSACDDVWQQCFRPPSYFYAATKINR